MIFSNEMPVVRKHKSMDDYSVSTWASVKAAGAQSLMETPTNSAWRMSELLRANIGKGEIKYEKYQYNLGIRVPVFQTEGKLPRSDAEKQIKDSLLPLVVPEEGYTQTALNIVMNRKKDELQRKAQIDATSGVIAGTAKFTMALGAQILDPANVALAFVPVIGPTKYIAMLEKATTLTVRIAARSKQLAAIKAATTPKALAKAKSSYASFLSAEMPVMAAAKVRAGVGAVEGLAGAAIAEPIIYMAMQKEQADYTMSESLLNVGLGTVFGAGLHAGAGAVGDAIKRGKPINVATKTAEPIGATPQKVATAKPETREAMLKTSISQEARGIQTDVEAIAANDVNLNTTAKTLPPLTERDNSFDFKVTEKEIPFGVAIKAESEGIKVDGILSFDEFTVGISSIKDLEKRGKGGAVSAYKNLIKKAQSMGAKAFNSDESVTPDAARVWESLKRQGYPVEKHPEARIIDDKDGGFWAVSDDSPPFKINIETSAPPLTAKPAKSLEATIENQVMRGDDPQAAIRAQETIDSKELNVDEELQMLTEQTNSLETMTGAKADSMLEYDNAIKKAESDAIALEAAVTCRMMK